jgi:hypothetical protein
MTLDAEANPASWRSSPYKKGLQFPEKKNGLEVPA